MRIEQLDPSDDARVEEVITLRAASRAVDFPDDPKFCPGWERGQIRFPTSGARHEWWLARSADGLDGVLALEIPELDNVTTALATITVHPASRRRSVGTALWQHANTRAGVHSRKLLMAESVLGSAAESFLRHLGVDPGLIEHRQRLVVEHTSAGEWDGILSDAYLHAAGYTVVRWAGDTPDEFVDGMAHLTARMSTDIPLGRLDWAPESWDADRIRAWDRATARWGGRLYTTAALHDATGDFVSHTTLCCVSEDPTHAWQWNTIVEPRHRGHRLGTVVKVENLRFMLEQQPAVRTVMTWNAQSNGPMNAVNSALGFVPIDLWAEWQLPVA